MLSFSEEFTIPGIGKHYDSQSDLCWVQDTTLYLSNSFLQYSSPIAKLASALFSDMETESALTTTMAAGKELRRSAKAWGHQA